MELLIVRNSDQLDILKVLLRTGSLGMLIGGY